MPFVRTADLTAMCQPRCRPIRFIEESRRYENGFVAGSAPCYNTIGLNTRCSNTSITLLNGQPGVDLSGLTFDQQFQAGLALRRRERFEVRRLY